MTQFPQLPPMGWYPDPSDPANERYWDGTAWTHNTKPAESSTAWPAVAATPQQAPSQQFPQGNPQQPYGQQAPGQQAYGQQPYGQPYPQQAYGQTYPYTAQGGQAHGAVAMTDDGVPLAGWWLRVGAFLLDSLLVGAVAAALGWPYIRRIIEASQLFINDSIEAANSSTGAVTSVPVWTDYDLVNPMNGFTLVQLLVLLAYLVVCYGLLSGTLFQRAFGMRVVPTGRGLASRLGWVQSAARALIFSLVTIVPLLPYLSYLMPLWSAKKQTLHDMVAGTQVVKRR